MSELLLKEEVHKVVGCAMNVLNAIGHGFYEKVYENALVVEFNQQAIPFEQQLQFPILYKNIKVGTYIPDLICFNSIVVDTKTVERLTDHETGQMLNYLKITGLPVGVLLNFKKPKLGWKRVVL